jgi:hypothetical protein
MEVIKRKIFLEDNIDRNNNSLTWGQLTATTFYVNIMLTQNIDNMGLFTDIDFSALTNSFTYATPTNLTNFDNVVLRYPNKVLAQYFNYGNSYITGTTNSKLNDVTSYQKTNKLRVGFDMGKSLYTNYKNISINGVDRITSNIYPVTYVFDASNDTTIGTNKQTTGILYSDYTGETNQTIFRFVGEGWNQTNTSLSAITKEEYLLGIISKPEIENDVFIDRGIASVLDVHLRLSEISNLSELQRYGNGFYNLTKE